jgi:hypothetical protein
MVCMLFREGMPYLIRFEIKKYPVKQGIGGESGIRTRGGLLTLTRFPGVRLKPLIHLSCVVPF